MVHLPEEVKGWQTPAAIKAKITPTQLAMARLEPAIPEPVPSETADRAIARLSYLYPWQHYSELPAAQSVTARGHAAAPNGANSPQGNHRLQRTLPKPKFVEEMGISAADRGTATHLVLQYFNFAGDCDALDVAKQIESLVDAQSAFRGPRAGGGS